MKTLPATARDWQLYTSMKGGGLVARTLTSALKRAEKKARKVLATTHGDRNAARVLETIYEETVYPVMVKHHRLGAADTEPRGVAKSYLDKVAEDFGFYCLDW